VAEGGGLLIQIGKVATCANEHRTGVNKGESQFPQKCLNV
jgi:hypothetical protein